MNRNIKRLILQGIFIAFIILGCFAVYQNISAKSTTSTQMAVSRYESILVYEGDSVWSIAKAHWKDADDEELTAYVDEIKKINHISQTGTIYSGRYLVVPIYEQIPSV